MTMADSPYILLRKVLKMLKINHKCATDLKYTKLIFKILNDS